MFAVYVNACIGSAAAMQGLMRACMCVLVSVALDLRLLRITRLPPIACGGHELHTQAALAQPYHSIFADFTVRLQC